MRTTFFILLVILTLGLISCNDAVASTDLERSYNVSTNDYSLELIEFTSDSTSLNQSEKDGLILMCEEEKLAGDVYAYFYDKYALRSFTNTIDRQKLKTVGF